jgi:rhamnulose-1-phosphate aldolase
MGDTGQRMWLIGAAEGAAGNLSVWQRTLPDLPAALADRGALELPLEVPALAGGWVLVTAAGRRIRDVATRPEQTLCALHVDDAGVSARLFAGAGLRPTSELNSHLAIHADHVGRRALEHHAVAHAQPLQLTFLSHIERYATTPELNRRLMRWQPETIVEFPEGIGVLGFEVPGSLEQTAVTATALRQHRAVVWTRHGIVTRADSGIGKAGDLVEYAEAAARYEALNLQHGEPAAGLSVADILQVCARYNVDQRVF